MLPDLCLQLHTLRREVLSARNTGRVVIEFEDGVEVENAAHARRVADGFLTLVNLPMLGRYWNVIDRVRAAAILSAVLDLEPEVPPRRSRKAKPQGVVGQVLAVFPEDAMILTSVAPTADPSRVQSIWSEWATELNAGLILISPALTGLLWVEDRL